MSDQFHAGIFPQEPALFLTLCITPPHNAHASLIHALRLLCLRGGPHIDIVPIPSCSIDWPCHHDVKACTVVNTSSVKIHYYSLKHPPNRSKCDVAFDMCHPGSAITATPIDQPPALKTAYLQQLCMAAVTVLHFGVGIANGDLGLTCPLDFDVPKAQFCSHAAANKPWQRAAQGNASDALQKWTPHREEESLIRHWIVMAAMSWHLGEQKSSTAQHQLWTRP